MLALAADAISETVRREVLPKSKRRKLLQILQALVLGSADVVELDFLPLVPAFF